MAHHLAHHLLIVFKAVLRGASLVVIWTAVFLLGLFIYTQTISPFNLVFGAPLALIGATLWLSAVYEMIVGVISWRWGRTHCPFCPTPRNVKKILSLDKRSYLR